MNVLGRTPAFRIAGNAMCWKLDGNTTAAWMFASHSPRDVQVRLIACSPEALIWCLSFLNSPANELNQSDACHELDALLNCFQGGNARIQGSSLSSGEPLVEATLNKEARRKFFKSLESLANSTNDDALVDFGKLVKSLCRVLMKSMELSEQKANAWLKERQLSEQAWSELASIHTATVDSGGFEIVLANEGGLANQEYSETLHAEKMASMKQLAYGASHEINNPLANIASRAQTLLLDETNPERRLKLAKINQQAFRAHEMIADMMLFAHPPQPDFSMTDPYQVASEVVSELLPQADLQGVSLTLATADSTRSSDPACILHGQLDPSQIGVALKALIQNSLESLKDSGAIAIQLRNPDEETLEITVVDDGLGFSEESEKHLFDPFYSGREAGRGLGFGLSKAWRIAELHGGEILAESPPEGGARFCLRIPYREVA